MLPAAGNICSRGKAEPVRVSIHAETPLRQPGHGAGTTWLMAGGQSKRHGT